MQCTLIIPSSNGAPPPSNTHRILANPNTSCVAATITLNGKYFIRTLSEQGRQQHRMVRSSPQGHQPGGTGHLGWGLDTRLQALLSSALLCTQGPGVASQSQELATCPRSRQDLRPLFPWFFLWNEGLLSQLVLCCHTGVCPLTCGEEGDLGWLDSPSGTGSWLHPESQILG